MEKAVTIVARFIACGFVAQPLVLALLLIPMFEGQKVPGLVWAFLGVMALLCVVLGLAIWRRSPRYFVRIFKKQTEAFERNT